MITISGQINNVIFSKSVQNEESFGATVKDGGGHASANTNLIKLVELEEVCGQSTPHNNSENCTKHTI